MPIDDHIFAADGSLEPVQPARPPFQAALRWFVASSVFVAAFMAATGPFRGGFADQLVAYPRFALEVLLGLMTCAAAIFGAFSLAVPGHAAVGRALFPAFALAGLWAAAHGFDFLHPALPPSMEGKREFCFYETFLYALVPVGFALVGIRRRFSLEPRRAAFVAGLAGAAIPATLMQLACMVTPWHVLTHHLQPVLWTALASGLLGAFVARPR